jgi:DNA polymerase III alpha subunit
MRLRDIKPYSALPFHGVLLPTIDITPEQRAAAGAKEGCSNLEFLTQLCRVGWKAKVAAKVPKEQWPTYRDRMTMEIETIEALGFTNYMLMVWDIIRFADDSGIPHGPGRGSVASSLVSSCLFITDVDPVAEGLFFTRFLSKARSKTTVVDGVTYVDGGLVADIDMDFCFYRRHEVIAYVNRRYPGQTAKLLTTSTFTSKILLKDLVKVYEGGQEDAAKEVSALMEDKAGVPVSVEDSLYGDQKWRDGDQENGREPNARLVAWAEQHPEVRDLALAMEGLNSGEGVHASALAICAMPIHQLIPLKHVTDKEGVVHVATGYDMYDAQELVLKFDILGLKTLSVLHECAKALGMDWRAIDVHHPSIYAYLQDFKRRYGIFQLETFAQGTAAAKVKPRSFEHLCGVVAIARPGAIAYLQQFADYVNEGKYNSIHPLIDDILKPTGGVCVYQEQYLAMLVKVGMHPDRAENARKVLGKKLREKVPEVKAEISEVCTRNQHPPEIVDLLLKIAEDSGGYQFSAAHSVPYSKITAYTLYLKANHPLQFFWALLEMTRNESEKYEKLAVIRQEMAELGLELLPPHFHHSEIGFKIESDRAIRFGLGMIRGISDKKVQSLELFRTKAVAGLTKFEVLQAFRNSAIDIGTASSLIQAGCLEGYDSYVSNTGTSYRSRSRLVLEAQTWNLLTDTEKGQMMGVGALPEVNWDVLRAIQHLNKVAVNPKGKPVINDRRFGTIQKRYAPYKEIYLQNSRNERLANYFYERRTLGYAYSERIGDIFGEHVDGLMTVADSAATPKNTTCRLIGFVAEDPKPETRKTSKGNDQFGFALADETGIARVRAFNERIGLIKEQNGGRLPEAGDLVICNCKHMGDGDAWFLQQGSDGVVLGTQSAKIFTKLSELRDSKIKTETDETARVMTPT